MDRKENSKEMKKKRLISGAIICVLVLVLLIGTTTINKFKSNDTTNTNNKDEKEIIDSEFKTYQTKSYLTEDIIKNTERGTSMALLMSEYTPENMLEESNAVVIASIISLDYADTQAEPAVGSTYGTLVVNNVLYGDVKQGDVLKYLKSGGIMTMEEYDKNQPAAAVEKRRELMAEAGIDPAEIYINLHFEDDPDIEEGKVYLCYLNYVESLDRYEILGLEKGLRELNIPKASKVSDKTYNPTDYKILNNTTGKYESLNDYIQTYIAPYKK